MKQSINRNWYVIGDEIADYCVRLASLKGITMQPLRAHNLEEAMGVIGAIPEDLYGLILTNNTLSSSDITAVAEALQGITKKIIIVLSGALHDSMETTLFQLGVKSILPLPLVTEDLYQSILDA